MSFIVLTKYGDLLNTVMIEPYQKGDYSTILKKVE